MQSNSNERKIAQPNSWKTVEMPTTVTSLPLNRTYTAEEFSVMARGFVPEVMEEKWFIFMQDNVLSFHRSWTGLCVYKVVFEQNGSEYEVQEALVNSDSEQYNSRDTDYEMALLSWLIDGFLLRKRVPFPVPSNLPKDAPPGIFQHHISGTAFPETPSGKDL